MVKAGDVFKIKTSRGDAYFQYVKKVSPMGALIRVLPGTFNDDAPDIDELIQAETNFWVFFPVVAAEKCGVIEKISNYSVPVHSIKTPVFRTGIVNPETKKVDVWWFWDGEKEWRVGAITREQRRMPIRGTWNDSLLRERIEKNWLPENDLR